MNRMTFHIVFPLACLILGGCDPKQPNIEIIQDMMDQDSVKAQDYEPKKSDGLAMRILESGSSLVSTIATASGAVQLT